MLDPYAFQRHAPTALIIPHTGGLFPAPGPRPEAVAAASRPAEYLRASRPRAGPQHPPAPAACPASGLSPTPDYRRSSDQPPARAADANPLDPPKSARDRANPRRHTKNRYKGTPQSDTPRKLPENALPDNPTFQTHQHPNTKPASGVRGGGGRPSGPSPGRASHNSAIMRRGPPLPPPLDITGLCQPPAGTRQHRSAAGQAGPRFALPPGPTLAADTLPEPRRTRKQGARSAGRVRPRRATRSPSAVTRPEAPAGRVCPSTKARAQRAEGSRQCRHEKSIPHADNDSKTRPFPHAKTSPAPRKRMPV
jgi:hypothetical protein